MHMNVFEEDAFSVVSLTKAIEDVPVQPNRIAELGLFEEDGIATTAVSIEKQGSKISLVPSAPRGSTGDVAKREKRQMISLNCIHLPQRDAINADEVQNVRAFGSESDTETAMRLMNKRLRVMKRDIDTTIEHQRMGAIKGQVMDADGTTVLEDLHQRFGTEPTTFNMALGTATTKVKQKVVEAKRLQRSKLGGLRFKGQRALCSTSYFDMMVGHAAVEKAFDRYLSGEFLRSDQTDGGFYFAGVFWEEYDGGVGGIDFVEDGTAILIPEGVADLFVTNYAPADYMEAVNTIGQAYYVKQEPKPMNKGIDVEAQSNPIHICTRPQVPVVLQAA